VDRTTDPIRRPGRLEPDRQEDDDPEPAPAGPASSPVLAPAPSSGSLPPPGTADPPAPAPPDVKPPGPAPAPRPTEAPDPPPAAPAPAAGWFAAHRPGGEVQVASPAPRPAAPAPPAVRAPDPPPAAPPGPGPASRADGEVQVVPPAAEPATPAPPAVRAPDPPPAAPAAAVPGRVAASGPDGEVEGVPPAPGTPAAPEALVAAAAAARAKAHESAQAAEAEMQAAAAEAEAAAGSVEAAVGSAETAAGSARAAEAGALAAVRSADAAAGSVETALRSAEAAAGSVEAALRSAEAAAGSARAAEVVAQAAVRSAAAAAGSVATAVRSAETAAGSAAAVRPAHAVTGLVAPAATDGRTTARRRPRRQVGVGALLVAVAVASGLAGGLVGATVTREREGTTPAAPAGPDRTPSSEQVQQVAASVLPAVVRVQARTSGGRATGSGVIFTADGYVLTNAHVVDGARTIAVTLATAEPLKASLVGTDPLNDLAVLRVRRSALPVASFGRSADLAVGDAAIVVGSPFGFQGSVTSGIVSALHRVVKVPGDQVPGHELVDAIQTDAAINPGNSGGALADGSGRVVGISTAIATSGNVESSAGVGFAIPIDEALEVARALVAKKPVRVPFLGWDVEDLSTENAVRYRLQGRTGALLGAVRPGSPAAKAALRKGDLVVRFGDVAVQDGDQLAVALRRAKIGEPVPIQIVRRGRELNLLAVPTTQPRR
jgi:S1-C subfamily serine protease